MSHNIFGRLFRLITLGESHGVALGCVVDGYLPGIAFVLAKIQTYLDKRGPRQSKYTAQCQELDQIEVLSGAVFEMTV